MPPSMNVTTALERNHNFLDRRDDDEWPSPRSVKEFVPLVEETKEVSSFGPAWMPNPRTPVMKCSFRSAQPSLNCVDMGELVRFLLPAQQQASIEFFEHLGVCLSVDLELSVAQQHVETELIMASIEHANDIDGKSPLEAVMATLEQPLHDTTPRPTTNDLSSQFAEDSVDTLVKNIGVALDQAETLGDQAHREIFSNPSRTPSIQHANRDAKMIPRWTADLAAQVRVLTKYSNVDVKSADGEQQQAHNRVDPSSCKEEPHAKRRSLVTDFIEARARTLVHNIDFAQRQAEALASRTAREFHKATGAHFLRHSAVSS